MYLYLYFYALYCFVEFRVLLDGSWVQVGHTRPVGCHDDGMHSKIGNL